MFLAEAPPMVAEQDHDGVIAEAMSASAVASVTVTSPTRPPGYGALDGFVCA